MHRYERGGWGSNFKIFSDKKDTIQSMPFHQKVKPDFESERNREKIED